MSFLRTRLSRVWGRGEVTQIPSEPKDSVLVPVGGDELPSYSDTVGPKAYNQEPSSGMFEKTCHAHEVPVSSKTNQPLHRRTLHKAASSTFKMLSDTIRSKTALFYTDPPEPTSPSPSEQGVSPKKEHRKHKIASFRGRHHTVDSPLPVMCRAPSLPHKLDVMLPISCLVGQGIDGTEDPHAQSDSVSTFYCLPKHTGNTAV